MPETSEIWRPLRDILDRDSVAVALPGFGSQRSIRFIGTKDSYAEWLVEMLNRVEKPVDVVGHDLGALLTMRVASAFDAPLRATSLHATAVCALTGARSLRATVDLVG
jgi:pimeloyl-ACP methyl ester carboxylesterase